MNYLFIVSSCITILLSFFFYQNKKKLFHGLIISLLLGVISGAIGVYIVYNQLPQYLVKISSIQKLNYDIIFMIMGLSITSIISIFLLAANYRKIAPNYWSVGILFTLILATSHYLFIFYIKGISAYVQLITSNNMAMYIAPLGIFMLGTIFISWLNYRTKNVVTGYKSLIYGAIMLYAGGLIVLGGGFAVSYLYGAIVLWQTSCNHQLPNMVILHNNIPLEYSEYEKNVAPFYKQYLSKIEYPYTGVNYWIKHSPQTRTVSQEIKDNTLALIDSKDEKAFFDNFRSIFKYNRTKTTELYLPMLNYYRSAIRYLAGKAALYHYTKQDDKILPILEYAFYTNRAKKQPQYFLISALIDIACDAVIIHNVVALGPNNKKSIPTYKKILDTLLNYEITTIPELDFNAQTLYNLMHLNYSNQEIFSYKITENIWQNWSINKKIKYQNISNFDRFLNTPTLIIHTAKFLTPYLQRPPKEKILEMPESEIEKLSTEARPLYTYIRRFYYRKHLFTLGLALKIYRCKNGKYPESLTELAPQYLEQLPTNEGIVYETDGENFSLKSNEKYSASISSKANY